MFHDFRYPPLATDSNPIGQAHDYLTGCGPYRQMEREAETSRDPRAHLTDHVARTLAKTAPHQATGDDSDEEDVGTHRYARRGTAFPAEQIAKFKGRASDNAPAFLYDIKSYFTCEGVPSKNKVPTFLMWLDGKAKDFFHNEVQNKNLAKWSDVETLFKKRYIDTDNREESRARLRELRHNPRATAHDFLQQAELLANKGYPDCSDPEGNRQSMEHLRATHVPG